MAEEDRRNHESFEILLTWLDQDRDEAWKKFEAIFERLIKIFSWNRRRNVEDLAHEVVTRVEPKVPRLIEEGYSEDPALYFYGTAYNLVREDRRNDMKFTEFDPESGLGGIADPVYSDQIDAAEVRLKCLDHCLEKLTDIDRAIILAYYACEGKTKLADRRQVAQTFGLSRSALWTRVSRKRTFLAECLRECLEQKGPVQ